MTKTMKPKKITFKHVEAEWYNYHETVREISRLRESIMSPFDEEVDDPTVVKGANSVREVGNPTERMAVRLTTSKQLSYLNEIVHAIDRVYNALPDDLKKLVRVRYWSNKAYTWDAIAYECHVSKRQAIRWRDEIVQATIEVLGWR